MAVSQAGGGSFNYEEAAYACNIHFYLLYATFKVRRWLILSITALLAKHSGVTKQCSCRSELRVCTAVTAFPYC